MKKLFIFSMVLCALAVSALHSVSAQELDFDSFLNDPLYQQKFIGTWKDETGSSFREFKNDGTGTNTRYSGKNIVGTTPFSYKVSDSQIIFHFTDSNTFNIANYAFTNLNTLSLTGWQNFNTRDVTLTKTAAQAAPKEKAGPSEPLGIDITGTFSYYPPQLLNWKPFAKDIDVGNSHTTYYLNHSLNVNLQMGYKMFEWLNIFLDFGLNKIEEGMKIKDIFNIMAKLNTKAFGVQLDYRMVSTPITYWSDYPEDNSVAIPKPDIDKRYNQTWMTTALMYTLPPEFFGLYLGLVYFQGSVPHVLSVTTADDKTVGFLADCPLLAVGMRYGIGWDHNSIDIRDMDNINFAATLDFGWGQARPEKKVVDAAKKVAKNPEWCRYTEPAIYIRMYGCVGLNYLQNIGKNKSYLIGGGLEVNAQMPKITGSSSHEPLNLGFGMGFYLRAAVKF